MMRVLLFPHPTIPRGRHSRRSFLNIAMPIPQVIGSSSGTADTTPAPRLLLDAVLEGSPEGTAPPGPDVAFEDDVDLLERLAARLRVGEEDVEEHDGAEGAEDHVRLPVDVGECGGDEEGEGEVEAKTKGAVSKVAMRPVTMWI